MVKKLLVSCIIVLLSMCNIPVQADELMDITRSAGYEVSEINRPKSSIIIDGNTGDILWEDNVDEIRDPASMSKLMTLYLVYEAISDGKLTEDTVITATATDQAIANIYAISNNNIVAGVDYTVSELITMTAVPSSNVATIMLANYLSNDDPDTFIDRMNTKAQELGMTSTYWFNASGAAASAFEGYYNPLRYDNYSANQTTARDMAILTYHFIKNYPAILEHTKHPVVTVKAGTLYEETFETYNYSLPGAKFGIEGVDGLKTGSSPRGAFNYIATIKRGEQRHIAVIMGVGDWSDQNGEYYRHPFGNALIEKSYKDFEYKKLLTAGKHNINGHIYQLDEDFYGTIGKGVEPKFIVEDDTLKLENSLEEVSPMIKNSIAVKTATSGFLDFFVNSNESDQGNVFSILVKIIPWLLLGLILVVIVMTIAIIERNHHRSIQLRMEERSRRKR
ncbi:D-alanyl-D-alanine carboxypeptidase [Streptococcus suis]|nr:D-alanyl-D-alanine carboxypeptidase [Streptococcus suis]